MDSMDNNGIPPSSLTERASADDLKAGLFDIANKSTIFSEIDKTLGRKKPCSVEYLITKPNPLFSLLGYGFNFNWFGHSTVIYTMPCGTRKVFNITGINRNNSQMISFYTPEDYLFDRNPDQGGIFNRDFIGIRIEDVPEANIIAMDQIFKEISDNSISGKAKFDIMFGPIYNYMRHFFPSLAERGNCARWSSLGLEKAGLVTHRSMFPKSIFIDMLENAQRTAAKSHDNVNVVVYKQIDYAKKDYGVYAQNIIDLVAPLQPLRNFWYWNLDAYARAIVDVPYSNHIARVTLKHPNLVKKPNEYRNMIVNNKASILLFGIASIVFIRKYPIRMIQNQIKILCRQTYDTNKQYIRSGLADMTKKYKDKFN
jgi:hypothetical protein